MSKRARRILVTLAVLVFAALIGWVVVNGKSRPNRLGTAGSASRTTTPADAASSPPAAAPATAPALPVENSSSTQPATTTAPATLPSVTTAPATVSVQGLRALAAGNDLGARGNPPAALGSLDPRRDVVHVQLSRFGAGIERIEFANIWQTAGAQREADAYLKDVGNSGPLDLSRLPQNERYVLVTRTPSKTFDAASQQFLYSGVPIMAARWLIIDGTMIDVLNDDAWSETAPGVFESRIINDAGDDVARLTRRYTLMAGGYDIALEQRVRNLTGRPMQVRWQQYGPVDLPVDPSGYIERRRLHLGYLPEPANRPTLVLAEDDLVVERSSAIKLYSKSLQQPDPAAALAMRTLWPNADSKANSWGISWFATTNRYFGLAVHPPFTTSAPAAYTLETALNEVEVGVSNVGAGASETLFTILRSPAVEVAPGVEQPFDVAIYAGPLDRHALAAGPHGALSMNGMIMYSMSGCCTFLTFQWLAHFLIWFLTFLHNFVFFDWGLAIIGLVIVVRTLLHPLTKKSQINMQRFGKQMQALKPEIDKLQKKFGSDPKRMQQEQMRLMREHHINPLQMLGCLPMFLQMPIWIALWAALYLAFDIRHQPAFYGLFQLFGGWSFLGDLSSQDEFITLGGGFNIPLVGWHVGSINLLPVLMGVVFFIQQKYMTPPPTATMTPEQKQQQAIMKWMMVILFPLMMYKSPSGLTLYIMTSSIIGILESRYVRRHIEQMDLTPKPASPGAAGTEKSSKPKDSLGRAWADRLSAMRDKQRQAQQERRSFKKRK